MTPDRMNIKIFADGADLNSITELAKNPIIEGFTTNPTLMRRAGVEDYEQFARDLLHIVPDKSVSFEVFSDELDEMLEQATMIASWGENIYVKIPITNTQGQSTSEVVGELSSRGVKVNVTATMTTDQVQNIFPKLVDGPGSYVSLFAGRVADTGIDPVPVMKKAVEIISPEPSVELIWASPREVLNVYQAESVGCQIITATPDIIAKISLQNKDLNSYSLETVRQFYDDGQSAGYEL
jgi:transaldolase